MDEHERRNQAEAITKALFGEDVLVETVVVVATATGNSGEGRIVTFFDGSQVTAIGLLALYRDVLINDLMDEV